MATLTGNFSRARIAGDINLASGPALAGAQYFNGAIVSRNVSNLIVNADDALGLIPAGVLVEPTFPENADESRMYHLNNAAGASGVLTETSRERVVQFAYNGIWEFAYTGRQPTFGQPALLVDNNTASAEDTRESIRFGMFTVPSDRPGFWFVDIGR